MAAALYLHNAIFTSEPHSPPPLAAPHAHRLVPNRRGPHDRQLSSVSSVTLHTSTSEHSHPTEPLIHPGSSESTVYLDLLARQPTHPSSLGPAARGLALSLEGDPVTPRERRVQHVRMVRKRLKRLRWVQRTLWVIIGGWATYNTARYYVGAVLHPYRERQVIALVLGSCTALCLACNLVSLIITVSAPRFGWWYRPRSKHVLLQGFLRYSSSLCLLAPSVVNLVLVFLWRAPSNGDNSISGRCHWDIDVVWTGLGGQCSNSPAWGFWLAGSIVRLLITAAILIAYHAVSYKYMVTRRPSRRRHSSTLRHSAASFPSTSMQTTVSSRSFRPMATVSSSTVPVSASSNNHASAGPRERDRSGNASDSEAHTLRPSRSRIMAGDPSPSGSKIVRRAVSAQALKSSSGPRQEAVVRASTPSSSDEETAEDGEERYGRTVHHGAPGYASVPLASPGLTAPGQASGSGSSSWDPIPDSELNSFAAHFRALVEQVTRETDEAVAYAQDDSTRAHAHAHAHTRSDEDEDEDERYDFPASYSRGGGDDQDRDRDRDSVAHVMLGRTIHRMPTIESLGSHEVMSLASMGLSRPSTRSNTLSNADGLQSRSASRANSLDAAMSLSVSVDGLTAVCAGAGEVGEVTPGSATSLNGGATYFGTRSTASYHTARSGQPEELTEES
ncbi:hypothetical protein C8Q80DRAFT_1221257 [Daedaleopsis nitida]|nr:hypothetical protein C8Q80DRAFT_1221257 [Daedaleopsis nitida]